MAQNDSSLSLKQRVALKLIFMALVVIQPTQYAHEITRPLDEIEKLIKAEA